MTKKVAVAGFETIGCDLDEQILRDFATAGGISVSSLARSTPIAMPS